MNKIAIFDWFGYNIPMEERYRLIKQAGFDSVLLWWGYFEDNPNLNKQANPQLARNEGFFIENIHTPFDGVNSIWCDNIAGNEYISRIMQCVDDCAVHQIPTMVVHINSGDNSPPVSKIGLNRIKLLVEKAEQKDVNIALENLRKTVYLQYVFDNIQSNKLGFCFDSGHNNCFIKDTDLLLQYGDKLMALHLHDNNGITDQHRLPFDGTIDWTVLMGKLKATGYEGSIALEIDSRIGYEKYFTNPNEFLALAYDKAIQLSNLL